ncbi:MAG: response regulator transcription factor [Anaerolineales bacterium]|nr:response regulator transcription factor [Anaerolineales bacterium]
MKSDQFVGDADSVEVGSAPLKILVADDHAVVRLGVRQILMEKFPVAVGEAANGHELLDRLREQAWDLLILDIGLPGRSGLELMPEIKQTAPGLRVLVLTMHGEEHFALRLLKMGVAGYLTKERAPEELVEAVEKIVSGGKFISSHLAERIAMSLDSSLDKLPHERLSDREFQVMRMLASGLSVAQIAEALSLHVRTVGTFRRHILRKLNLKSTQEIIYYAIRGGLID